MIPIIRTGDWYWKTGNLKSKFGYLSAQGLRGNCYSFRFASVRRVRNVCAVLLAFFWLVASSHPVLESVGLIHRGDRHTHDTTPVHEDDGDQDHDAADGKCPVAFAKVSIPRPPTSPVAFGFIFSHFEFFELPAFEIAASGLAPPHRGLIPISSWQFSLRTALAPRAPSFLS